MEDPVAQAASDVAEKRGISYFSSAGNMGRTSFESEFQGIPCPASFEFEDYKFCHDFGGGSAFQQIVVSDFTTFFLQWDDPSFSVNGPSSGGAKTDLDVLVFDSETGEEMGAAVMANVGADPIEVWTIPPGTYNVAIVLYEGPKPSIIKWFAPDDWNLVSVDPPTNSGTLFWQANTPHTAGVGAAFEQQIFSKLELESYSSAGGTPLLFDRDGSRKAQPMTPNQPRFIGPDG